ncbi:FliG C-terminal domain-containing protein [Candidatus Magnetaquicoccus inordinatus]|uniref:FliG C-terminal domain-containing protein n=1 Tax=Candidatus Magnetaquicoccus inordinatus TaxID=2496818 RepID=UPI00102C1EAE|nr:FliG C-terminal domain-containing protein [Candidatus Magnetaquicoccus inordinatus]
MSIGKAAAILSLLSQEKGMRLLSYVEEQDEGLARQIRDQMLLFSDLLAVDERGLQNLLRETEQELWVVALKGAEWPLVERILDNLTPRAADALREAMVEIGPVQRQRIHAARQTILQQALALQARGQLWFRGKGRDHEVIF